MSRDIRGNPWKFDLTAQGEGLANEGVWLRHGTFTAAATDIVTATAHGMSLGTKVRVEEGNSDLPSGLAESTDYWVGTVTADTFKLYATRAAAFASGTAVDIVDAGTTPNYILLTPVFEHKIYVKNIVVSGDGTNEGTVEVTNKSGGYTIARTEVSDKDTGQSTAIVPIYDYVDGIYITTLDASNAVVLVYHGRS
jgi:hypothetical protein